MFGDVWWCLMMFFFDFDGVVLESSNIKTEAFVELFNHLSPAHQKAIHNYHVNNMGVSRYKKFEWIYKELLNEDLSQEQSNALGEGFSKIVYEKILQAAFVPGVQKLLDWAKKNTYNFVASGTPETELRRVVNDRELGQYFKEVLGSPKSKEEIVNEMISKYDLDRSRCWFIGDATTDYKAAKETDLNFVARNSADFTDFWSTKENIIVLDDLSELLNG